MIPQAILLWCAIIPLAILNGILRDMWLAKRLNPKAARLLSGIILSAVILGFATLTITWLPPARLPDYLALGGLWLGLTLAFEFSFGRLVARKTWDELLRPYRFKDGDIWPVVLLVVTAAPAAAAWLRDLW